MSDGFKSIVLKPFQPRLICLTLALALCLAGLAGVWAAPDSLVALGALAIGGGFSALGLHDYFQKRHAILRNYPIAAHLRFLLEEIRPEMRQYFFEDEKHGQPFSRDKRSIVYQRAKGALDKRPFGTNYDVYASGFEWLTHSLTPVPAPDAQARVRIGGADCAAPYDASLFNVSAMSFGALSANAIRALNKGAALGGFAHDTGEGGFSPHHASGGGDVIWEIGSGYFGARDEAGRFSPERFAQTAADPQIRMVELKLNQGAKPGHGGVLPAAKVTPEIARTRGVPMGQDCVSPARHSAFATPLELMLFIGEMRRLSGGKPAGFKLCIGHEWEFLAICKAMIETGVYPDFIVVDGSEGGTGAAPLEFMDHLGKPLREGLTFVRNALIGIDARERVKIGASGKIASAFDMARAFALGADWCNSARGFMFALGCIQSQSCHTDMCPTGVATQDPGRQRALVVPDKARRVADFHGNTLHALAELAAAAGLDRATAFDGRHITRRLSPNETATYAEIYPAIARGELLAGARDERLRAAWNMARAESFAPAPL